MLVQTEPPVEAVPTVDLSPRPDRSAVKQRTVAMQVRIVGTRYRSWRCRYRPCRYRLCGTVPEEKTSQVQTLQVQILQVMQVLTAVHLARVAAETRVAVLPGALAAGTSTSAEVMRALRGHAALQRQRMRPRLLPSQTSPIPCMAATNCYSINPTRGFNLLPIHTLFTLPSSQVGCFNETSTQVGFDARAKALVEDLPDIFLAAAAAAVRTPPRQYDDRGSASAAVQSDGAASRPPSRMAGGTVPQGADGLYFNSPTASLRPQQASGQGSGLSYLSPGFRGSGFGLAATAPYGGLATLPETTIASPALLALSGPSSSWGVLQLAYQVS